MERLHTQWPQRDEELEAWRKNIEMQLKQIVELSPGVPDEVQLVGLLRDPERLGFVAAGGIETGVKEKQRILEEDNILRRLHLLSDLMAKEVKILKLRNRIQSQVRSEIEKDQKEYWLKEQMKAIQKELGSREGDNPEAAELRDRLAVVNLPDEVRKAAEEELDRLARMPPGTPEVAVSRTYIEWIATLPWLEGSQDSLDVAAARSILDEDHYDLKDVKERIIEFLAVKKLNPSAASPILCFVGPPGVGKTSMGQSIARAMGRRFVRISLGGVHDEAEIRGHRRTYVGAMPGRIIQGLREAGTNNPVFMLDEVDKIGRDFRGDPTSALLEALDPEQNFSFRDNYLNVPFDLRKVEFITTANQLDTIPPRCWTGWRSCGCPATRGGEAGDRKALPRSQAGEEQRAGGEKREIPQERSHRHHRGLYERGGSKGAGAPDRKDLQEDSRPCGFRGKRRGEHHGRHCRGLPRPREVLLRDGGA